MMKVWTVGCYFVIFITLLFCFLVFHKPIQTLKKPRMSTTISPNNAVFIF